MGFLWIAARKDLLRRAADRAALLIWIGIPIVLGSMMALLNSGGGGGTPRVRVLLVDKDDSFLSNLLAGSGGGREIGELLELETVELEEGRARIDAGEASALLILPEGFGDALLRETPTELTLVTNPAQTISPRIVREALELLVEAAFYAQRLMGEPIRDLLDNQLDEDDFYADSAVAAFSGEINRRMRALEGTLFPPVLDLEVEVEEEDEGGFNFGVFFLPGLLFMSLLFIAQGTSDDVWKEQRLGTLRRLASTPRSLAVLLGGKLLAGALLMTLVGAVGLVFAVTVYDLSLRLLPLALLWSAFGGTALLCLFFMLQSLASSQRAGNVLGMMVLFPLMMIGGSFFPFEAMPAWMADVGRWTPNGLSVLRLKELLRGELNAGPLLASAAGVALSAAITFGASLRIMSRPRWRR